MDFEDQERDAMRRVQSFQKGGRIVSGVFGFIFFSIGISLLFSALTGAGMLGRAPLMFRIVPGFISLAFVAAGGGTLFAAIKGTGPMNSKFLANALRRRRRSSSSSNSADSSGAPRAGGVGYSCARCGAPLGKEADVSPKGDVRCHYCKAWFNIHERP